MVKFTLRVDDDELIGRFDELAKTQGKTRTAYIIDLMHQAVDRDYVPAREGEGFRALTDAGGEVTLMRHDRYVSGGLAGLDKDQTSAYERAREVASPENGSQWKEARQILEQAGFSVYKLYAVAGESI
jgi:predicted transcriptional regulator